MLLLILSDEFGSQCWSELPKEWGYAFSDKSIKPPIMDIASVCMDSVDMQYMKRSTYNNVLFISKCFHEEQHAQWYVKALQKYWTRKQPDHQYVSSSSDGLVQNYVTLSQWFPHKTAVFYTEQCTSTSLFHNFEVSWGTSNRSLKNNGFICNATFFTCTHVHKSLSNET